MSMLCFAKLFSLRAKRPLSHCLVTSFKALSANEPHHLDPKGAPPLPKALRCPLGRVQAQEWARFRQLTDDLDYKLGQARSTLGIPSVQLLTRTLDRLVERDKAGLMHVLTKRYAPRATRGRGRGLLMCAGGMYHVNPLCPRCISG